MATPESGIAPQPAPGPSEAAVRPPSPKRWGRVSAMLVASAPTVGFVAVNAFGSLASAVISAGVLAFAVLVYQLIRGLSPWHAIVGLLVVVLCAVVAAVTGEAKGFFLVPALVTVAIVVVCAGSILVGRPLSGLLLNRVSGGPSDWYHHRRLRRLHVVATWMCAATDVVSLGLTLLCYLNNSTVGLAAVHGANAPAFAAIVAVTIARSRRAIRDDGQPRPGLGPVAAPGSFSSGAPALGARPFPVRERNAHVEP